MSLTKLYLNVKSPEAPLPGQLDEFLAKFAWYRRVPCWLRLRPHHIGCGFYYTGSAQSGFAWEGCERCGRHWKRHRVVPALR